MEWSELGFFIATAKDGYIIYSTDGFNWIDSVLTGSLYGGCWSKELGIFVIVGDDIIYTSSLKNRKPTNENIFNNEFNSIDEDGTWSFNSLNTNSILLNGSSVSTLIGDKQDKLQAGTNISIDAITSEISCDLTAGENIDITDGVISSTGGGTTIDNTTDLTVNSLTTVSTISVGGNASITGNLTTPNRVRYSAYRSDTYLYNAPPSDVVYNIATYNVGSAYDTTTGIFTAPIAGAYFFTASFYSVDKAAHEVHLKKNGTIYVDVIRIGVTTFGVSKNNGVCQVYLAIGDTMKLEHTQGSIQLIGSTAAINVFTGYLIG